MTLEQQGAYLNLLSHAWQMRPPCTLPNDDRVLAHLSGLDEKWTTEGKTIRRWFVERYGRLVNKKLLNIYREACRFREQKREAGKEGNAKRWKNHKKEILQRDRSAIGCDGSATRKTSPPTPTPTPTPTPSSVPDGTGAASAPSPKDFVWDAGVKLLAAAGVPEHSARSFLGRHVGDFGEQRLAVAIATVAAERPVDPKSRIAAILRGTVKNSGRPKGRPGMYVSPSGRKFTVAPEQFVAWADVASVPSGWIEGFTSGREIHLLAGGKWE